VANIVRVVVTVWNRQYELIAHQKSKAAWIALGDFNSKPLEGAWLHSIESCSKLARTGALQTQL